MRKKQVKTMLKKCIFVVGRQQKEVYVFSSVRRLVEYTCASGEPESIKMKWPLTLLRLIRFFVNTHWYLSTRVKNVFLYLKNNNTHVFCLRGGSHAHGLRSLNL